MFSQSQFNKSAVFIRNNARELDQNLFSYEFGDNLKENSINSLKKYKNSDNGYGNGLEPDIQSKNSSIIATTIAFQYIDLLDIRMHALVEEGIKYFESKIQKFDKEFPLTYFWQNVNNQINDIDHAPWWNIDDSTPNLQTWVNPTVEIIGYFNKFPIFTKKEVRDDLNEDLSIYLEKVEKLEDPVFYNFLCFKRTLPYVSNSLQTKIFNLLDNTFEDSNLLNPMKFGHMKIQSCVTEKSSYLYKKFPDQVKILIENEINRMEKDGGSHPEWKWGNDNIWPKVEKDWSGKLTMEMLSMLKHCDLLETEK